MPLTRRDLLKQGALLGGAAAFAPGLLRAAPSSPPFLQSPLPYAFDALEPAIDQATMEIHHGRHHAGYVTRLNQIADRLPTPLSLEELVARIPDLPQDLQETVRHHGGGHLNHELFWSSMAPPGDGGGGLPTGPLAARLQRDFGSIPDFLAAFQQAAASVFGSGWVWLVFRREAGRLAVTSTPNQDNPLMRGTVPPSQEGVPLLGLDVWEHAYYLHYQNRRADYASNWWKVVRWSRVSERLATAHP